MECHLCNSNWAAQILSIAASPTVGPPVMRSSTYRLWRISSTSAGNCSRQSPRCSRKTPPSKKGDGAKPKRAHVDRNASISLVFRSLYQWNRIVSLSSSQIRTWRIACLRTPEIATGWKRFLTRTLHSWFWIGDPILRHSFKDGAFSFALADAS